MNLRIGGPASQSKQFRAETGRQWHLPNRLSLPSSAESPPVTPILRRAASVSDAHVWRTPSSPSTSHIHIRPRTWLFNVFS